MKRLPLIPAVSITSHLAAAGPAGSDIIYIRAEDFAQMDAGAVGLTPNPDFDPNEPDTAAK